MSPKFNSGGLTCRVYVFVFGPNEWRIKAKFQQSWEAKDYAKNESRLQGGVWQVRDGKFFKPVFFRFGAEIDAAQAQTWTEVPDGQKQA